MNETHSDGVFSIKPKNRKITVYKITAVTTSRFVIYSTVFVGMCNCAYTSSYPKMFWGKIEECRMRHISCEIIRTE